MDTNLAGRLLIALPAIEDPRFKRATILLCSHSEDHAMGIVLNRVMDDLSLPELLDQLGVDGDRAPDAPILMGGPVGKDRGFVLHSEDHDTDGATVPVLDGVCMTSTRDVLEAITSDQPPEKSILALGYAGWGPGQLEEELASNEWMVGNADQDIVYDYDFDTKWARALASIGISPDQLQIEGGQA